MTSRTLILAIVLVLSVVPALADEYVVPLFMSASNAQQQGFIRIVNHSNSAGSVQIRAVDDSGYEPSALSLRIGAGEVVHFNSNDLELGNLGKGLAGSTGAGTGNWRLVLDTSLDIEPLAYVRTADGFLTSIHDMALTADRTHYIPTFNPGSNLNQQSILRLVNRQAEQVNVTIDGLDDRNSHSGTISLALPARNAIVLTAAELEDGPRVAEADGALGDGSGKWRLFIQANRPIHAMSLLEDPNGYLANLSASRKTAEDLSTIVAGLNFTDSGSHTDQSIVEYLNGPVDEGRSPALWAAIVEDGHITALAASGVRRQGSAPEVTARDIVHIGSNTKAMTATMLATLVADGTFTGGWQTTVVDVFPELEDEVHSEYRSVTLRQLVGMAGGIPRDARDWWAHSALPVVRSRYLILREHLALPPAGGAGDYLYSNLSYVVAGAMAERSTGKAWETLMRERLFIPLKMSTAGFGPPGSPGLVDQPWGHRPTTSGQWAPNQRDNSPALGPAGRVHLSLEDWAKFIEIWFPANVPAILDRSQLNELTVPIAGHYAAGWGIATRGWAGGVALNHSGSNLSWHTVLWVAPNLGRAYVAVANSRDDDTFGMLDDIIGDLITHTRP